MESSSQPSKTRWMIYGANGYTGSLAARLPRPDSMLPPILAGRNLEKIKPLAQELKCDYRIFSLDDPEEVDRGLHGIYAVVLAAGPFSETSKPMVDACLRTHTHYLDITGEWDVFESVLSRHAEAAEAGIALLPGIGMDVVPTDCLASKLKGALPSATHLQMILCPIGGTISPGTMKTVLNSMGSGTKVRRNGAISDAKNLKTPEFDNPDLGKITGQPITWGDISTAYYSTSIPNIGIYLRIRPEDQAAMHGWKASVVRWLYGWSSVRWLMYKGIERFVTGPTPEQNKNGRVHFSGIAWDEKSYQMATCSLTTMEGYQLTATSMITAVHKLINSHMDVLKGAFTPSQAFGTEYITEFENTSWGNVEVKTATPDEISARAF